MTPEQQFFPHSRPLNIDDLIALHLDGLSPCGIAEELNTTTKEIEKRLKIYTHRINHKKDNKLFGIVLSNPFHIAGSRL